MDSDLFMECEEEELEPWQQLNSGEDSGGNAESSNLTAEANMVSFTPAPAEPKTVVFPNLPTVVNTASTVPLLTNTLAPQVVHTAAPADIPQAVQGQQVFLTPGGGLGTMALSQVLLPGTSPIANATSQPIYFTTQGLPVQNIHSGQNPMGLVFNVQQGQTVRPITLLQAPGTQLFKPAIGTTQIITQPAQLRTATPLANRAQTPCSFSTVQIPATLTIRTTTALTQPKANTLPTMASTAITQPSPTRTTTKIVTIKQGNGPLDVQNLMSLVKSVTLPGGAQAQTFVVMSNQKTNGPSVASSVVPVTQQNVVQTIPITNTSPSSIHICPRCGAPFKMVEALRSHMCFCCPDLAQMSGISDPTPAVSTPATPPKNPSVVPKISTESQPTKAGDPRLVMLVDDFYYGTFEGNRVYVPMDNSKEPLSFKCHSCNKRLKNNIRFMNHLKNHVELEQQNGEMDTHTSCQHCFRRFPTPFRLQCHLESVHTAIESSTKCKICEWSFESEPVFLQHMKNTHKPGEMPYVCQVCEYRSSFYSDVFNHFRTWHEDTRHLLCQYCLKVFKNSRSFQQHYVRHQKSTVYHCNKCRLQFLFTKDKVEHKINHHRTFRKPSELEGLQPGTKVTIRAYVGQKKTSGQLSSKASTNSKSSIIIPQPDQQSQRQGPGRKQVSKMFDYLAKFQEQRALLGRQKCLECTFDIPDFANHYPTYVHCSLCLYSTCCSRAYANHMINNHVPGRVPKASKKGPPSGLKLSCADCDYSTDLGNLMAKHLVKFPSHSYCIFSRRGNAKVGFITPKKFKVTRYVPSMEGNLTAHGYNTGKIKTERGLRRSSVDHNSISGVGLDEDMDQEMAPLEDEDTDTNTDDSDEEQPHQNMDRQRNDTVTNSTLTQPVKHREEILSIRQRRILLLALCCGIQKASKEMGAKPQLIKTWLGEKEKQVKLLSEGSSCGEAIEHLVEWVLAQREQQRPISEAKLFEKASELQSQTNDFSFCISYEWAVSFMLRHKLGFDASVAVRELPRNMEENCLRFTGSMHSQIQTNIVKQCVIGAMDQLSVFVDFNMLNTSTSREKAFQLIGSGKPFVKIYLSMLADGTVLPAMLFTSHAASKLSSSPPDSILLMSKEEGFSAPEELEIWATQVWKRHLDSQNEKEALLVMDSHHSNVSEEFISTVSSTKTLTAIVPVGCTCQHQPLEMCVRPVLQRFFHARWAQYLANDIAESEVQPEDLLQRLVAWLEDAMSCFSNKPEVIQHSFCLARVIPDQEKHETLPRRPLELFNLLSEAILGPEVLDSESSEEEPVGTSTVDKVGQITEKIDLTQDSESIDIYTGDKTSQVAEKIDLTQENDEDDQTDDEDQAQTYSNETEQQTQERIEECLEISSESTDFSHSSPESEAPSHNSEQDNISESGLDPIDDQTDSASNR